MSKQQTTDSKQPIDERYEVAGHGVQITHTVFDQWMVWLNIESDSDHDGLCVGCGSTRHAAVNNAVESLSQVVVRLQQLAPREVDQ